MKLYKQSVIILEEIIFLAKNLYLNEKRIIIQEENEIPCEHINFKKNNDYLFKVTYFERKINIDINNQNIKPYNTWDIIKRKLKK